MTEVEALINLLHDDDPQIAIVAMEKLLSSPSFIDDHLRDLQESSDPKVRSRIHQMESIITRQKQLDEFITRIKDNKIELWEDLITLNKIIDRDLSTSTFIDAFESLTEKMENTSPSTLELATFMREQNFSAPSDDILDPGLFLIYEVVAADLGNPLLLCIVTRQLALRQEKKLTIVLHKGRHCLIDDDNSFIDPHNSWAVTRLRNNFKVYPCTNRDILLTIISQLYLSALVEGHLRIISFLSQIMSALSNMSVDDFPYPVGKQK
ncbi:MAG: hypothetical protein MK132_05460 [Lentisphaerales bacterium]|nr:hypothetical protein [Lentisphaerales bacterium]